MQTTGCPPPVAREPNIETNPMNALSSGDQSGEPFIGLAKPGSKVAIGIVFPSFSVNRPFSVKIVFWSYRRVIKKYSEKEYFSGVTNSVAGISNGGAGS